MKEMKYQENRCCNILDEGIIDGYSYKIVSLGWHPCAYIQATTDTPFNQLAEEKGYELDIPVHCGCTFIKKSLWCFANTEFNIVGWDYNHCYDYSKAPGLECTNGYKWTTKQIKEEVLSAIKYAKNIDNGIINKE